MYKMGPNLCRSRAVMCLRQRTHQPPRVLDLPLPLNHPSLFPSVFSCIFPLSWFLLPLAFLLPARPARPPAFPPGCRLPNSASRSCLKTALTWCV